MNDDKIAVSLYREKAATFREAASRTSSRLLHANLQMAAEYEWRAACIEAALALQSPPNAAALSVGAADSGKP